MKQSAGRSVDRIHFQALELGSRGRKDEQQLVQRPLSKPMMPPANCRVRTIAYVVLRSNFQAVGKWTESTP